jgi:hypothetical protein
MQDTPSPPGKIVSLGDSTEEDAVTYDPIEFDPEQTSADDDPDLDPLL